MKPLKLNLQAFGPFAAREEVDWRVRTLDLGADDYLVKPFSLAEFDARVRALLRRHLRPRRVSLRSQPIAMTLKSIQKAGISFMRH